MSRTRHARQPARSQRAAKRPRYSDNRTTYYGPYCAHCDGEHARFVVRLDDLRDWICPHCDDALDAMSFDDPEPEEVES